MDPIAKLRERLKAHLDLVQRILAGAVDKDGEPRDLTEAEQVEVDEAKKAASLVEERIKLHEDLREAERRAAATVTPINQDDIPEQVGRATGGEDNRQKGSKLVSVVRNLWLAQGNISVAAQLAEKAGDREIAQCLQRGLNTGYGPDGGFLVPPEYVAEVIDLLRAQAVIRSAGARVVPMRGSMTMPRLTSGASVSYIGEDQDIPVTKPEFGQLTLRERKLVGMVPVSNDLLRLSNPDAEAVIRDDLVRAMALGEDYGFIRGTGQGNEPMGLRYQAPTANRIPVNGTVNIANITVDLGKAISALMAANVSMTRPVWIMHPTVRAYLADLRDTNNSAHAFPEVIGMNELRGYPIRTTTQIPVNLGAGSDESEIYFVDANDLIIGEVPGIEMAMSMEATYMENSQLVSAWSRDQSVIRAIGRHDMGARYRQSIAVLTGVTWGL